jgi:hypothetical protein
MTVPSFSGSSSLAITLTARTATAKQKTGNEDGVKSRPQRTVINTCEQYNTCTHVPNANSTLLNFILSCKLKVAGR